MMFCVIFQKPINKKFGSSVLRCFHTQSPELLKMESVIYLFHSCFSCLAFPTRTSHAKNKFVPFCCRCAGGNAQNAGWKKIMSAASQIGVHISSALKDKWVIKKHSPLWFYTVTDLENQSFIPSYLVFSVYFLFTLFELFNTENWTWINVIYDTILHFTAPMKNVWLDLRKCGTLSSLHFKCAL